MTETLRHKEAFEFYYSLGDERSLEKVSQKYTVSIPAVKKWSKAFNWQERVFQRDLEVSKKLEEKTNNAVVNEKAKLLSTVKATLNAYITNLRSGIVNPCSISDLEKLIKLALLLMGQNTESTKIDLSGCSKDDLFKLAGLK